MKKQKAVPTVEITIVDGEIVAVRKTHGRVDVIITQTTEQVFIDREEL